MPAWRRTATDASVGRHVTVRMDPYRASRASGTLHGPTNTVSKEHIISASKLFFATVVATIALGTPFAQAATAAYPPGPTAHASIIAI
ncbi:hypothetical protein OM076_02685 [Solirubrobacter ginsenosidimutans]|uniref:Uncharacterized protein n=1 Tax=Solirubrobacter ginsenosidimutans TaxID=490573 RepID=A0A9X3MMV3_9ACTN|nr:hypothetical protein [Solirubrobacter ginsenosidimutans]MDA0159159.1 hypothetical protein [Solirubrobacter ginsenosidimutans]